jgi:ribosomal protein L7/L12
MNALAQALSQPATLLLVAVAFGLGFLVRGIGVNSRSPPLLTQAQVEDALSRVTKARWAEIDRAIDDRKKLLAIKLLREQTGLGLKASKEAIEARMQSRHRMRG